MEKIPKFNKRRVFNKAVGPGKNPKLISVGPTFIPDYRVHIWKYEVNISHLWIFINLDILCWRSFQLVRGIFAMVPLFSWLVLKPEPRLDFTCATYNKLSYKTCENAYHQANNLDNIPHFLFTNAKSMYVNYILRLIIISHCEKKYNSNMVSRI